MSLLTNAIGQYIDANGKARALFYTYNSYTLCLMIEPIPPLNVKNIGNINFVPIEVAQDFINEYDMVIDSQHVNNNKMIGVWLISNEFQSELYIPITSTKLLENIPENEKLDPLRTSNISLMKQMQNNRKIAEYLKQYSLYIYSMDPENFGEKSYILDEYHIYNIESISPELSLDDSNLLRDGHIIVNSEEMLKRLLSYVQACVKNQYQIVDKFYDKKRLDGVYNSISDFKVSDNQLIFLTPQSIKYWKKESQRIYHSSRVYDTFLKSSTEPYFFNFYNLEIPRIVLIQNNIDNSYLRALAIGMRWLTDRVNEGYEASISGQEKYQSHVIYKQNGENHKIYKKTDTYVHILQYDNGDFATILLFD